MDWIDAEAQTTTASWQSQLGIDWTRVSCHLAGRTTPTACVNFVRNSPTPGISKYFLYMNSQSSTLASDAAQYSSLTTSVPSIESVGFDDFFIFYQTFYSQKGSNAPDLLGQIIDDLKSINPNLKFGITLYETDLDSSYNPYIDAMHLPTWVKAKFDYIHLFLHYRANASKYATYVSQAHAAFPNAKIIAGAYPYDRVDFFPCTQGDSSKTPCTSAQETSYFQQALTIQVQQLKQGSVIALEFFPGYFGDETELYGTGPYNDSLPCSNVSRCVQNTITMRNDILSAYNAYKSVTVSGIAPTLTEQPTNSNLSVGETQIFQVDAAGTSPLYYQWRKNGSSISGATSSSYHTLPATLSDNNASFTCTVSNAYGSITSRSAVLTVTGSGSSPNSSPTITEQPANASLSVGQTEIFRISASGGGLSYQWKKNGSTISGATQSSYHTLPAAWSDNRSTFQCVVSNSYGSVTSQSAVLTITSGAASSHVELDSSQVRAYPNPWRSDRHGGIPVTIDGLPEGSTVNIFTVSAHWIKTVTALADAARWDLTNTSGEKVASGIYLYLITTRAGEHLHGQIAVIK